MTKKLLIYIEYNDNSIQKVSKEIIAESKRKSDDIELSGVVVCSERTYECLKNELEQLSLDNIYVIKDNIFDIFNAKIFANSICDFINTNCFDIFLMGATEDGRELAPRVASTLDIGLTADCTDIDIDKEGNLLATRPTYGGKLMATITSKTKPNFATIRTGAFRLEKSVGLKSPEIQIINPNISGLTTLIEIIKEEKKPEIEDWTCSEIIVAGGLGLQTKENFELIYKLAEKLNAKPAASRAAVELGWASESIQVGQTGSSVSPKLYLAFGISGAMQHLVGISNADKIIAVNTDRNAPIMRNSDIAIVADAVAIIQELLNS